MKFKESALAHRLLDGLKGIEIGGSAHNPFSIPGCLNVNWTAEHTAWTQAEKDLCGEFLKVDVVAEADNLPFPDDTWDFVLNSHVLEHLPDMLGALVEWARVIRDGGFIYIVYPEKDANPDDQKYDYTTHQHILEDYRTGQTVDTHPCLEGQGPRGHYHFFTLESFIELIGKFFGRRFEVIETEEKDSKVGNGWTCVIRVNKPILRSNILDI